MFQRMRREKFRRTLLNCRCRRFCCHCWNERPCSTSSDCWGEMAVDMIGREYLARQAMTLLRMARVARNPQTQVRLAAKAVEMKERLEEAAEAGPDGEAKNKPS